MSRAESKISQEDKMSKLIGKMRGIGQRLDNFRPKNSKGDPITNKEWAPLIGTSESTLSRFLNEAGEFKFPLVNQVYEWIKSQYGLFDAALWITGESAHDVVCDRTRGPKDRPAARSREAPERPPT